jgi:putative ABC transport system permease protein
MIQNNFKIAWRTLKKNGVYTAINVFGLSIALAIFLFLVLFVKQELSFNQFNINYNDIVRVGQTATFDGQSYEWATVPNIVGPTMSKELPEIRNYARLLNHNFGKPALIKTDEDKYTESKLFWTDVGLFDIFDVDLIEGSPQTALDGPNKILLSESVAKKYFGEEGPIGKILKIDHNINVEVSGVFKDFPVNSTIDAELLGSFNTMEWASKNLTWSNASFETYFLLNPKTNLTSLEEKVNKVLDQNVPIENQWFKFWLQPLSKVHLYSSHITNSSTTRVGDFNQVKILLALAFGILFIACINYMNLATAQSQRSQKEVGLSKVMGATRWSLIRRFYAESFLMVHLSVLVGVVVLIIALPFFNNIADTTITWTDLVNQSFFISIFISSIVLSLFAGSYPALLLTSFSPLSLFGRKEKNLLSADYIRRGLVIMQFTASIVLIICTIAFFKQLSFMQSKNLGFDAKQIVSVSTSGAETIEQINGLIEELKNKSFVKSVSRAQALPGESTSLRSLSKPEDPNRNISIYTNHTTSEIFETMGMKLLAGNTISPRSADDDTLVQVVLNESAIKFYGFTPENAIGKTAYNLFDWSNAKIVGVVEDFHFEDFKKPIGAYAFHNFPSEGRHKLLIKFDGGKLIDNMKIVEKEFNKNLPNATFEYTFLNETVAKLHSSEVKTSNIVLFFSIIAILIACLGLFGLAAYAAERRKKEIGVRKVLGSTVEGIIGLMSLSFLKLLVIAFFLATPLAWFYIDHWLSSFSYRIEMPWWSFGIAGLITLIVAMMTVSFQSIKAALVNPVKSLRSE